MSIVIEAIPQTVAPATKCETKTCRTCGQDKPITDFYSTGHGGGRKNQCAQCGYDHKIKMAAQYQATAADNEADHAAEAVTLVVTNIRLQLGGSQIALTALPECTAQRAALDAIAMALELVAMVPLARPRPATSGLNWRTPVDDD